MKNPKIKYRNGKTGVLLTTDRPNTSFPMVTMDDEHGNFFHHSENGKYLSSKEEEDWDVVCVEGEL
jgi:hypothetical protein